MENKRSFFKRKEMPIADASQFTSFKKFNATSSQNHLDAGSTRKQFTSLTTFVPRVSGVTEFLPVIKTPLLGLKTFTKLGIVTGRKQKG